jgi:hypothetical protein
MILEERTYVLNPRFSLAEYLEPYVSRGLPVQVSYLGEPVGAFTTDVGELHSIVSLWRYEGYDDRAERRARLAADPRWQECLAVIRPMILSMKNRILLPLDYSRLR